MQLLQPLFQNACECLNFFKMLIEIANSNVFESILVIKILHVGFQYGGEEHYFDTWRGCLPLEPNYLDVFKEKKRN